MIVLSRLYLHPGEQFAENVQKLAFHVLVVRLPSRFGVRVEKGIVDALSDDVV